MNKGWIKLHRKINGWEWYDKPMTRFVFIHLLLNVNFEQNNWKGYTVNAGELITSRDKLAKETGFSVKQVRTAIENLVKSQSIEVFTNKKFTLIKVANWDEYQKDQQTTNKKTNKRPTKRPTNGQLQTNPTKGNEENTANKRPTERPTNGLQNGQQTATIKELKKIRNKEYNIFNLNLNTLREEKKLSQDFIDSFLNYWTKDENGSMKFQKLPFFDFERQIEYWKNNKQKFSTPKNSHNGNTKKVDHDERKRIALAKFS